MFNKTFYTLLFNTILAIMLMQIQVFYAPALAEESQPECWAAIVGITEYACPFCYFDQEWNIYPVGIKHPDDDARDLALQLSPVIGQDHIKLVLNDEATNTGIYYAIEWLADKSDAEDTVLFYFSGHSAPQYLGSYDYIVSDVQLADWLDKLNAQNVVIILDTCYAGSFIKELGQNGRVVLMSCQANESSLEDRDLEHGVFTHYILQAFSDFNSADSNQNYELSAKEMFDYAKPKTIEAIVAPFDNLPAASRGNVQHPTLYTPPGKFNEINLFMNVVFQTDAQFAPSDTVLTVDGKPHYPKDIPSSFTWLSGTAHRLDVPQQMNTTDGTRLVFTSWNDGNKSTSRMITHGGEYTADYKTQYELAIESAYGSPKGVGWHDADSMATISIDSTDGKIIKHIFTGWSGDLTGREITALVTMDKPKTIKANWETDYLKLYLLLFGLVAMVGIATTVVIYIRNKKKQFRSPSSI
jgi:hypothetical protein